MKGKVVKPMKTDKIRVERSIDFSVHPHQLRHTCITRWFRSGLDLKEVQYLAGHASIEMTLRVYTHYEKEARAVETAEKIRCTEIRVPTPIDCNVCAT